MTTINQTVSIGKPVLLQNTKKGPSVFHDEKSSTQILWEGVGDPSGRDTQPVPLGLLENPNLQTAISNGTFKVVGGPQEILDALTEATGSEFAIKQAEAARSAATARERDAVSVVKTDLAGEFWPEPCIGPSARGGSNCGAEVPVKKSDHGKEPVLCAQHANLKNSCIEVELEQMDPDTGKALTTWTCTKINAR